jgi:Holliday junction resolvasome RuvABC DNA-binding subunit
MRDRLQVSVPVAGSKGLAGSAAPQDNGRSDALQALLALGYKDAEVRKMLATVAKQAQPTSTEEYIRLCLKQMAGSGAA